MLLCTELVASGHLEWRVTLQRPLCVCVLSSCPLFTGRAGRTIMLIHANLLFLPPSTRSLHCVGKQEMAANRQHLMLMIMTAC